MASKGRRRRTKQEIARDRAEIEKLRLRYRLKPTQIVEKIKEFYTDGLDEDGREIESGKFPPTVGFEQVKKEIQASTKEFVESRYETIQEKRTEIIRQFEDLAVFCQERYDSSIVDKVTITKEERNKEGEVTTVEKEVTVNTDGNARYLDIKKYCLQSIAELEAVIPPKKFAPTNPDGTEAFKFTGDEELKRLEALIKEAGGVLPKRQ